MPSGQQDGQEKKSSQNSVPEEDFNVEMGMFGWIISKDMALAVCQGVDWRWRIGNGDKELE